MGVPLAPKGYREAGSSPLGIAVDESPGAEATALQLPDGIVGVHAVRAPAVGDHLCVLGQCPQVAAQLGDGDRPCAGDVSGFELDLGTHVEHDDLVPLQAARQLVAVDDVDTLSIPEIGVGQTVQPGDVLAGDVPEG